ncbi:MAG: PHP domain-containing protein [bacterium]
MKARIDLHLHTSCSDSVCSPLEILQMVRDRSLKAFAITDHDTLTGYETVKELLTPSDPELVPGVEVSCATANGDLHLLGYLFDPQDEGLNFALTELRIRRNKRGHRMVQRLNDMGIDISYDDVQACASGAAIGRPHVAAALVKTGAIDHYLVAFRKYIGDDGPAFVPKHNIPPPEAIKMIHMAGGVVVMAHPLVGDAINLLDELVGYGLDGLEAYYPDHSAADTKQLIEQARRCRLLVTGGSDFHGRQGRAGHVGSEPVGLELLEALRARAGMK